MGVELELVEVDPAVVADLRAKLVDPATALPEKYRVLFSLRNVKGHEAHEALTQGEAGRTGLPRRRRAATRAAC